MLGSRKSGFSVPGATTLISQDTVIEGDIRFSGTLDIVEMAAGSEVNGSLKHVAEGVAGDENGPGEPAAGAALPPDSKVD